MSSLWPKRGFGPQTARLPTRLRIVPDSPRAQPASGSALWLGLYFPALSFEALENPAPDLVLDERGQRVHAASGKARAAGAMPGMSAAQAYALSVELKICQRDLAAESRRLRKIADWLFRFSSQVSLQPPQALLLEIGSSLKLFGGLESLLTGISTGLREFGISLRTAVSPTPLASLWLAQSSREIVITDLHQLRAELGKLPVDVIDASFATPFKKLGVKNLQELWRLPREGLARRFDAKLGALLDQALGLAPDPQLLHKPSRIYRVQQEVPETRETVHLLLAIKVLLNRLLAELRYRDRALERLLIHLHHEKHQASELRIGLRHGSRDAIRVSSLIQIQLERLILPADVTGIALKAISTVPYIPDRPRLAIERLENGTQASVRWHEVQEQIEARLGPQALRGLTCRDDHRPEHAWRYVALNREVDSSSRAGIRDKLRWNDRNKRPLWLLPEPQPLTLREGKPWKNGHLKLVSNGERIEGGWWDGKDIRRNYYTALDPAGSRLWIYRDAARNWYLHGYFA